MSPTPEPFSRILIDKALEASGWNLLDSRQVRFEVHTGCKHADYVLMDKIGRVLCVLETKRADHDLYDAKEQARGYVENLKAPFVILSNGTEHWFWNYERADHKGAYRITVTRAKSCSMFQGTRAGVRLYHHPGVQRSYQGALTRLTQFVSDGNRMQRVEGESLAALFDLNNQWPDNRGNVQDS